MTPIAPPKRKHSHFLLGDLKDFQEQPLEMLLDIADHYGPVTQLRFAHVPQIVITHPDGARHVLQKNNRNYLKEQQFMDVTRTALLSGDDLFTSDGEEWLRRRRLMQPAFHRKMVAEFADLIRNATHRRHHRPTLPSTPRFHPTSQTRRQIHPSRRRRHLFGGRNAVKVTLPSG